MYSEQGINNTINISTTSLTNATQLTVIGNNNSVYIGRGLGSKNIKLGYFEASSLIFYLNLHAGG
ncbi:hypothetical protein GWC84_10550 [Neisseria meningitidis]|nr:hypothetical protein [Neisseria meningitidis]